MNEHEKKHINNMNEINSYIEKLEMINPPVHRGSTVLFKSFDEFANANSGSYKGIVYGTDRLPVQRLLEEALRCLEGGHLTRVFQSGINAIINTLLCYTKSGDHVLLCDNVYFPTGRFCREVLTKYGISHDVVPSSVGADITDYIKPETVLIFLESPGSNTFEIQDIPAITRIARERGIVTVLDNTWATPLFLDPFKLGIDVSIQSITKYISGHSDLLMGSAAVNERHAEAMEKYYRAVEAYVSPDDCYLALRGLATLEVRLRQHEKSALEVAEWLKGVDAVGEVVHPAMPSHPEHALWKRDFTGSSGLFSFTFKEEPSQKKTAAFVDSLEVFGIGYSWGGYRSLVTAGHYNRRHFSRYAGKTVVRLNIGLEGTDKIISDLEKGFDRFKKL